jgi:hypothetical protein
MAKHTLPEGRRTALCGWLTANGINPHDVPADADMTIDKGPTGRFLRCEVFDRSLDGRLQVDERGERVALMVVNVPLQVEPPEWWTPYEKPTREQLLTVVDRVRKLHHDWENDPGHCAHCTGPDGNLVPFPCPTIRALDGPD